MPEDRAVYVVNINGEQFRRPAKNPFVPIHKIKQDIKTYFKLDYDFDLKYKGAKLLETSTLSENCFDDSTPLVVSRKNVGYSTNEFFEDKYHHPAGPQSPSRQTPLASTIHTITSRNNIWEEEIQDEIESEVTSTIVVSNGYQWKSTTIFISPARSVDEEEINLRFQASATNPLLPRSKPRILNESVDQITDEQPQVLITPSFAPKEHQVRPSTLSINADTLQASQFSSRSPVRKQMTIKVLPGTNSPVTAKRFSRPRHKIDSTNDSFLLNDSPNAGSRSSSLSTSRSSSPSFPSLPIMTPAANRDVTRKGASSSQITVHVQTLNDVYIVELSTDATLQQLRHTIKQRLEQQVNLERYSDHTHTLLFFNHRMHIFKNIDIENERINTFLSLNMLSLKTNRDDNNNIKPDFFVYALNRKLLKTMYIYEKDPTKFFDNSIWWQSHSEEEQNPLAQSTLLSTLYVLYQYFRRPSLNEKATRRALEIQFLLYLRKHLFPPAFQALKHLLIREMFAFEKAILMDGLLKLLSEFCPSSIDQNLLGIYAPHLFCWLFDHSLNEMETQDGFLRFDLKRYSSITNLHYINDPITIHDLDHDRNVLYEYHEAERYKNITRNIDIFSLIKYLQNPTHTVEDEICAVDVYTIDMYETHCIESINCLSAEQISKLEEKMARVYRSFTLLIRNTIENSDVRDQLILVNNKQVGICFKRRQRIKNDGKIDQDLQCFMPAGPSHKSIVTINASDVFEVEYGRPDPHLPNPLRSNLPLKSKPIISSSRIEQITLILLDISSSMFTKRSDTNTISKRFIDISINMLMMISKNLHRQSRSHAIGIILFDKDVIIHCPVTTNADEFEKAVYRIPKHGQPWTSMYEAINTGLENILQYESNHTVVSNCNKLIICITDGINNRGALTIANLKQRIRRTAIVIDLIFFSSDTTTSQTLQEKQSIAAFRALCAGTGGIIYRNSSVAPIDLAITFEQEAVIWLNARKERKKFDLGIGMSVDGPISKEPEKLYQTAVRARIQQRPANNAHQQTDLSQRLQFEANDVARQQIENIQLYICAKKDDQMDFTFWKVILQGPSGSLYAKGRWLLHIIFSDDYPTIPPMIRFHTPICHLNISTDGHISHDLFDIGWSTVITMVEIFRTLIKLLRYPDIHNAVSEENVLLYEQDRNDYELRVCKHCEHYALKTNEQLKSAFRLEDS